MTEETGLGKAREEAEKNSEQGEHSRASTYRALLRDGTDGRAGEQGRSPSPREYTLKPDTFLARTDLGRLRRAGL